MRVRSGPSPRHDAARVGPGVESESGRGLLLAALADDGSVTDRCSGPGKTGWVVVGTVPGSQVGALRRTPAGSPGAEPA
ncbi:hypothetical protein ABZ669_33550 [Streptomyces hirsutus]|uniref:hypothetical protein n=1 Tax=Streptomyces hirsutus TaxID=35620 RepID=UPI0034040A02